MSCRSAWSTGPRGSGGQRAGALDALALALAVATPASVLAVDFVHEVMPILKQHCGKCHTGKKKEGGLAMNTRAQLLAGGESGKAVALKVVKPPFVRNGKACVEV